MHTAGKKAGVSYSQPSQVQECNDLLGGTDSYVFHAEATMYEWSLRTTEYGNSNTRSWRERGTGRYKLVRDAYGRIRAVMHHRDTGRLCANHPPPNTPTTVQRMQPTSASTWRYTTTEFCAEEPARAIVAVRFLRTLEMPIGQALIAANTFGAVHKSPPNVMAAALIPRPTPDS